MLRKRLTRTGSSTAIILDKPLLRALGWNAQTLVDVSVEDGAVVIRQVIEAEKRDDEE